MTARTNPIRSSVLVVTGLLLVLTACTGSAPQQGSDLPVGSTQINPQTGLKFVVESNHSGAGPALRIVSVQWGRLVDIFAPTVVGGPTERLFDDFLVGANLASDGVDYELVRNPGTGGEELTILHPFGTAEFANAFAHLEENLQLVIDKSLDVNELPPFTAVPRNAAVMIRFDDLVDETTLRNTTVKVGVGYPPTAQFAPRLIPDVNHGDLIAGTFHTTRVIVDMAISEVEAAESGAVVNSVGLPEAATVAQAGVVLRLPTRTAVGSQFELLTNLSGSAVSLSGNGSTDPFSASLDVVRAFRAGGRATVTGDPFNGFLDDSTPPSIVSSQSVQVTAVQDQGEDFLVDVLFSTTACAMTPREGDVLRMLNGVFAQVVQDGAAPSGGTAFGVRLHVVVPSGAAVQLGAGEYRTPWLRTVDQLDRPECWVNVSPTPAAAPDTGLSVHSTFSVRFSEAMDPGRVSGFDTMRLLYGVATPSMQSQVVGQIAASSDLTRFTFVPQLPLRHAAAATESYRLFFPALGAGPVDLAGNGVVLALTDSTGAQPNFTIAAAETPIESRSIMMKFSGTDEDPNATPPGNDLRGQIIYDLQNGRIRPRTVARLSGICDPATPMVQMMAGGTILVPTQLWNVGQDTPLPLWRYGCRLETVWRYPDMGFRLMDDLTHNLDVEGLAWAPLGAGMQIDNFPQFQIGLAHCLSLPDEGLFYAPPGPTAPPPEAQPLSSISDVFADNLLSATEDPMSTVHPKAKGYTVQPLDLFVAASGTRMAPWPLNRGVPPEQYSLYTWRDTSKVSVGQPDRGDGSGKGVPLLNEQFFEDFGMGDIPPNVGSLDPPLYAKGLVPTIGLPLLMDFRCYPDALSTGANRLTGILAVGPAGPTVIENPPYFTAYAAGNNVTGIPNNLDPDQQPVATGSNPPGGANFMPRNQFVFFGQGDFVTRVNRAHTRWFECAPSAPGATFSFADPVVEPGVNDLPPGTQVLFHYRGATAVTGANSPWAIADNIDPYGNPRAPVTFPVTFTGGAAGSAWKSSIQQINGSNFFQARITMISNTLSGAIPEVSSLGFTFYR